MKILDYALSANTKSSSMQFSKTLDKIAGTLESIGLVHLASSLDVISNTLEKFSAKKEELDRASNLASEKALSYGNEALKKVLLSSWDEITLHAYESGSLENLWKKVSKWDYLEKMVKEELKKEGGIPSDADLQYFDFETYQPLTAGQTDTGKPLLVVRYSYARDYSFFDKGSATLSIIHLNPVDIIVECLGVALRHEKTQMYSDPEKLTSVKPVLVNQLKASASSIIAHEFVHSYQYRMSSSDSHYKQVWEEKPREKGVTKLVDKYRHHELEQEPEAVRAQLSKEFENALRYQSPARVNEEFSPKDLTSKLYHDWGEHTPRDLQGVYQSLVKIGKDNLLSSRMIKSWKAYITGINRILTSTPKVIPEGSEHNLLRNDEQRKKQMKEAFKGFDLAPYISWNPSPTLLQNKKLIP